MACSTYDELTNGLKMLPVGLAIGAVAWFIAGSGAKEGYEKRKREREREAHERQMDREKAERERERERAREEREDAKERAKREAMRDKRYADNRREESIIRASFARAPLNFGRMVA